jgi:hypothetical protein
MMARIAHSNESEENRGVFYFQPRGGGKLARGLRAALDRTASTRS